MPNALYFPHFNKKPGSSFLESGSYFLPAQGFPRALSSSGSNGDGIIFGFWAYRHRGYPCTLWACCSGSEEITCHHSTLKTAKLGWVGCLRRLGKTQTLDQCSKSHYLLYIVRSRKNQAQIPKNFSGLVSILIILQISPL